MQLSPYQSPPLQNTQRPEPLHTFPKLRDWFRAIQFQTDAKLFVARMDPGIVTQKVSSSLHKAGENLLPYFSLFNAGVQVSSPCGEKV